MTRALVTEERDPRLKDSVGRAVRDLEPLQPPSRSLPNPWADGGPDVFRFGSGSRWGVNMGGYAMCACRKHVAEGTVYTDQTVLINVFTSEA